MIGNHPIPTDNSGYNRAETNGRNNSNHLL
jgi:hypothetical protein